MKLLSENLIRSLQKVFIGDIEQSEQVLEKYSRDASMFIVRPQLVVFPKNSNDIKNLVIWIQEQNQELPLDQQISLTMRAAGTDMSGAAIGESIIVDTTRYMNRIISITSEYAIVEPGCYYRDLERETLKQDVFFPSFPASRELCALGGMYSTNRAGDKQFVMENLIIIFYLKKLFLQMETNISLNLFIVHNLIKK